MTDNSNNVVKFPENRVIRPTNIPNFNEDVEEHKIKYIDVILSRHMQALYNKLSFEGINTENEQFYKDYSFVVESLRAALYRSVGITHPIHQFVDVNFELTPEEIAELEDDEETSEDSD